MATVEVETVEALRLADSQGALRQTGAAAVDALAFSATSIAQAYVAIVERLRLSETMAPGQKSHLSLTEALRVGDALARGFTVTAEDSFGFSDSFAFARGVAVLDTLGLSAALSVLGRYGRTVTERVRFRDTLSNFFGLSVEDTMVLADGLAAIAARAATVSETLELTASTTPTLMISLAVEETLDLSATQALKMVFSAEITETFELELALVEPGGGITTWAMNTRTGAVTEYANYDFNSFAVVGNIAIGASATGLYELMGDDDDGEDIVARLQGGFLQFGGTHLSRLKAAYIALRGEGKVYLKIIGGDDTETVYRVDTRDMRSTKVHMGKGLRARYFAYELTSVGQDFDLDTIEFVPLVMQRRV